MWMFCVLVYPSQFEIPWPLRFGLKKRSAGTRGGDPAGNISIPSISNSSNMVLDHFAYLSHVFLVSNARNTHSIPLSLGNRQGGWED